MRILVRGTLRDFWESHADAEKPLRMWCYEAKKADWSSPVDIKRQFSSADFLRGDRVVFNIGGNKYRLVVKVDYPKKRVFIRFIGTHAEYDKIDAVRI